MCPLAADLADEERMGFLTSHVAPGDVNAHSQIMSFWSKAVAHAYEQAFGLSLEPNELVRTFAWGGATAPGLELAVDDMLSSGELVQRSEIEVCLVWNHRGTRVCTMWPDGKVSRLPLFARRSCK